VSENIDNEFRECAKFTFKIPVNWFAFCAIKSQWVHFQLLTAELLNKYYFVIFSHLEITVERIFMWYFYNWFLRLATGILPYVGANWNGYVIYGKFVYLYMWLLDTYEFCIFTYLMFGMMDLYISGFLRHSCITLQYVAACITLLTCISYTFCVVTYSGYSVTLHTCITTRNMLYTCIFWRYLHRARRKVGIRSNPLDLYRFRMW
jgi:hypothetical protein